MTQLKLEGFEGIWDFFFSSIDAVEIFKNENITGEIKYSFSIYINSILSYDISLELFQRISTIRRLDQIVEHMFLLVDGKEPMYLPAPQIYPVAYFPSYKFEVDLKNYSEYYNFK